MTPKWGDLEIKSYDLKTRILMVQYLLSLDDNPFKITLAPETKSDLDLFKSTIVHDWETIYKEQYIDDEDFVDYRPGFYASLEDMDQNKLLIFVRKKKQMEHECDEYPMEEIKMKIRIRLECKGFDIIWKQQDDKTQTYLFRSSVYHKKDGFPTNLKLVRELIDEMLNVTCEFNTKVFIATFYRDSNNMLHLYYTMQDNPVQEHIWDKTKYMDDLYNFDQRKDVLKIEIKQQLSKKGYDIVWLDKSNHTDMFRYKSNWQIEMDSNGWCQPIQAKEAIDFLQDVIAIFRTPTKLIATFSYIRSRFHNEGTWLLRFSRYSEFVSDN